MNFQKIKLGLVALVLGFGLVVTQSAFTPKFVATHFNNAAPSMPVDWQPLGSKVIGPDPGQYSCVEDEELRPCTANYNGTNYTIEEYGKLEQN